MPYLRQLRGLPPKMNFASAMMPNTTSTRISSHSSDIPPNIPPPIQPLPLPYMSISLNSDGDQARNEPPYVTPVPCRIRVVIADDRVGPLSWSRRRAWPPLRPCQPSRRRAFESARFPGVRSPARVTQELRSTALLELQVKFLRSAVQRWQRSNVVASRLRVNCSIRAATFRHVNGVVGQHWQLSKTRTSPEYCASWRRSSGDFAITIK
jgi:hypothetical protein